jgi:integrase
MTKAANGRSSIHRRTNGLGWEGWVSLGVHPVTARRQRKHVRGRTKSEVMAKIEVLERQRSNGVLRITPALSLQQWLDIWLAGRIAAGLRPSSISSYRTDLKHVSRSGVGDVRLLDLGPEHVERIYAAVLGAGCSAGSAVHVKRALNAALNQAVRRGHIGRNPVALASAPRHEPPEVDPYTAEEISRILAAARTRRNGARWSLALLGLRQGEVLGLRWPDIDLNAGELTVRRSLGWLCWQHGCVDRGVPECGRRAANCPRRHSGGAHLGQPKSAAGRRTIALPAPVIAELRQHRACQDAERLAAGSLWHDALYVITTPLGRPVHRNSDRHDWTELVAIAGVRPLRIHDLRHSAATALLVLGEDSRVLLAVMGWTSMSLAQRYTHLVPDMRRQVATRQASLWSINVAQTKS